jgi:hypothetical protein
MAAKISPAAPAKGPNSFLLIAGLLALVLGLLFCRSFIPQDVVFSNDGPLGGLIAEQNQLPQTFTGLWADLNSIGSNAGAATLAISELLRTILGPLGYAKFLAPSALFILGLGAWAFFRALKFSQLAAILGALAAMLNSTYFADAGWGDATHEIAAGMDFLALALVVASTAETPWVVRWTRLALAGLCVGVNVMEGADIGALYSILIAAFVFFKSVADPEGTALKKIAGGVSRVAVISVFAGFIAYQTVIGLVSYAVVGAVGTAQDEQTKAAHWDFATQWSEPKKETPGLFVPGLFGYKMDTPNNMMPLFQNAYKGGNNWGGVGRDPAIDRFYDKVFEGFSDKVFRPGDTVSINFPDNPAQNTNLDIDGDGNIILPLLRETNTVAGMSGFKLKQTIDQSYSSQGIKGFVEERGDTVKIIFPDNPAQNVALEIDEDGNINLPLLGQTKVAGLSGLKLKESVDKSYASRGIQASVESPGGTMRFTGGENYCGIMVVLVAFWAVAQSLRRRDSVFSATQRRHIWFWAAVILVCVPLSWGRFAPFFKIAYALPYFSTIRNPIKFLIFTSWAFVILFGYGVNALSRRHLEVPAGKFTSLSAQLKSWWAKAGGFDRKWTFACAAGIGVSLLVWIIYASEKPALVRYLQTVGFGDTDTATEIAAFSIRQVGWFILLFAVAAGLLMLVIAGIFSGKRARLGGILLGAFLIFDLGRANLPYVCYWDYLQKYEVGSLNPIETFLKDKPYEHRVAYGLPQPLATPGQFGLFGQLYGIEWTQHHFLYYNIQSLDIVQMPRMPADLAAYNGTFQVGIKQDGSGNWVIAPETFPRVTRLWELTNTRYLLGPAPLLDVFNSQFDPEQHRFRIIQRFNVLPKPGVAVPDGISPEQFANYLPTEKVTAFPNTDGAYALFEFTGALPRAKLYSNWQVNTNDATVLTTLADTNFDPAKTVLISTPQANLPDVATNENSGTVGFMRYDPENPALKGKKITLWNEIKFWKEAGYCYAPKDIMFDTKCDTASVLLLNDKFDPNWSVTVDGKPAELLRCNYIMRGVYLAPGNHAVEFTFTMPNKPLYVTLAAIATGLCLVGLLIFLQRRNPAT